MGDRHVQSDENKQILYIDAKNLYGWAMSQYLPTGEFENISFLNTEGQQRCNYLLDQIVEDLLEILDDNENGFFLDCDLEYSVDLKKTKKVSIVSLSNKSRSTFIHTLYELCKST